jgi:hypothetical protein
MSETDSSTSSVSDDMLANNNDIDLLEPIVCTNNSFEVCILRILHILFSEDNTIVHSRLHQYMDDSKWCDTIKEYFYDNPGVMKDANFYKTNTGIILLEKWVSILNTMTPDLNNFINFMVTTFPLLKREDSSNIMTILNSIYSQLNKNIRIEYVKYLKSLPHNQTHKSIIQHIYININQRFELCYIWELIELSEADATAKLNIIYSDSELRFAQRN